MSCFSMYKVTFKFKFCRDREHSNLCSKNLNLKSKLKTYDVLFQPTKFKLKTQLVHGEKKILLRGEFDLLKYLEGHLNTKLA
jgi:hypothetical protein